MAETTFNTTAVNWASIGDQLMTGAMKAATLAGLRNQLISSLSEKEAAVMGALFDQLVNIAVLLGEGLHKLETPAFPIIAGFVAPILQGLFGADVDESTLARRLAKGGGAAAGQSIVDGLFKAIAGDTPNVLQPTDAGARRIAGAAATASLEATFNAIVPEMLSDFLPFEIGHFKELTELPEGIIGALGIGRLVRRAVGPYVDATCTTPLRWYVNKNYRPELLSTSLAVRQFVRGKWDRAKLTEELARQGFDADRIEALIFDATQRWSTSEIKTARYLHSIEDSRARELLALNGWKAEDIDAVLRDWQVERILSHADRELSALSSAYVNREITAEKFGHDAGFLIHDTEVLNSFKSAAETARTLNVKHLSHAEIKDAVTRGIATRTDYRRWLDREGYPTDEATMLELLLLSEISDQRELDQKRAQADAERAAAKQQAAIDKAKREAEIAERNARTFPSLDDIKRAVVRGLLDVSAYAQRLTDLKYAEADRAFLIGLVEADRESYLAAQQRKADAEAENKRPTIGLADLETAVVTGRASLDDYRRRLQSDQYAPADVALMAQLLADRVQDAKRADDKRRAAEERLAHKGLSLSQVEKAVRQGLRSLADYRAFLIDQGFAPEDAALLSASLDQDIRDAAAAAAKRDAVNATASSHGVSLSTLERAVKLGVRTRDEYAQKLIDLQVPIDDQVTLLGLLDAELANANAARATREQPPPTPAPPGLTRSDLESAVRAGLASIDTYRQFLATAGYSDADAGLLSDLLLLEVQDSAAARVRRDELDADNPTRALARSDIEKAVKAGIRTMADYRAQLDLMGYTPDDRELLVTLLQHDIAAKDTAAKRRAALVAPLAAAGVELDALDAAVLDGSSTLDAYVATLQDAGLKPVDVALLVQLLLEKAAGGSSPGSA